jgi:hypothetical protein
MMVNEKIRQIQRGMTECQHTFGILVDSFVHAQDGVIQPQLITIAKIRHDEERVPARWARFFLFSFPRIFQTHHSNNILPKFILYIFFRYLCYTLPHTNCIICNLSPCKKKRKYLCTLKQLRDLSLRMPLDKYMIN